MCHCLDEVSFSPQQRGDVSPGWSPELGRRNHNPGNVFRSMSTFFFTRGRFYGGSFTLKARKHVSIKLLAVSSH